MISVQGHSRVNIANIIKV